jgi:hypothetical protein
MLLGFYVGAQDCIHVGQMAFAAGFEPLNHIVVEAQMYGSFPRRHNHTRGFPEVRTEGFRNGGVGSGFVESALAHCFDFAK